MQGLIEGNWSYEQAGLLDEDHVRCFTRRELEKLLFRAGYANVELADVPGAGYREWKNAGSPTTLQFGKTTIADLPQCEAAEFFVYQLLARAVPSSSRTHELTSIIILTHNQLPYTRQCIESIRLRTDPPYELVFVDNASTDGTPEYLRSIGNATVISNSTNLGFAAGVNQGLQVARGKQILLLNNDTLVSTGWLEGLLEALYDRPDTGLVGPVSNRVSGPQQIAVTYDDIASMDGFAWQLRRSRQLIEVDRLVGFCLLFRRDVIDEIGLLDERFEIGCFEDDDFCRRALQAGFKARIASNVFVHHFGSVTFQGAGLDFCQIMEENKQKYDAKWQEEPVLLQAPHDPEPQREMSPQSRGSVRPDQSAHEVYEITRLESGAALLRRKEIRLSLCMIVRDNQDTMAACLESIYPWVDELVIVDTGSVDGTQDICRQFGARIFEFPWCDDFSAARNASLGPARGEWIFWMDSDDVIPQEQGKKLRELVLGPHSPGTLGYVMQVHCPSDDPDQKTVVDHVKLFRNLPQLRFEHRIHEQILPAIRQAGGEVSFTDIHVVHSGSRQPGSVRNRKIERDFRILHLDLEERPNHPFVLFNLGMTCEDVGRYEEADEYLQQSILVAREGESHLRKAWALRVSCHRAVGRTSHAIEIATDALFRFPNDKELLFRRAMLYQDVGQFEKAVADYERVLQEPRERTFQSLDPSICSYKAQHNLAMAFERLGRIDDAIHSWEQATQSLPEFQTAWLALLRCCIANGRFEKVRAVSGSQPFDANSFKNVMANALLLEVDGEFLDAASALEQSWEQTGDTIYLDEAARVLVTNGLMDRAIPILDRLKSQCPGNAAVLHNLGAALHACGQADRAIVFLNESLQIRPDASHSSQLLADAYRRQGNRDDAARILQAAIQRNPQDESLREALRNSLCQT